MNVYRSDSSRTTQLKFFPIGKYRIFAWTGPLEIATAPMLPWIIPSFFGHVPRFPSAQSKKPCVREEAGLMR
jgi:hypothetical protein